GEVREEVEPVVDRVGLDLGEACRRAVPPFARPAHAVRPAAVGGVDGAEAADLTAAHRALRHLVRGMPPPRIGHGGEAQATLLGAARVAQDGVELPVVVGDHPGAKPPAASVVADCVTPPATAATCTR